MYFYTLLAALVVIVAIFLTPLRHKVWVATATIAATAIAALTFVVKAFSGDVALIDNIKIQAPTELIQYVSNVDGYNETAEIRLLASDKLVAGEKIKKIQKLMTLIPMA